MGGYMAELIVSVSDLGIDIAFDKYFGKRYTGGKKFNTFSLTKKKTYKNISDRIAESIEFIGNNHELFVYNYHKIKCAIVGILDLDSFINDSEDEQENPEVTLKQFYLALDKLIDDDVVDLIDELVEGVYVEQEHDTTKVRNPELEFKSKHTKIICKLSFAMKLCIPLLLDFCDLRYNLIKDEAKSENPVNNFIFNYFIRLMGRFSPKGIDIENKIFKLVESRVIQTNYSDKIMWNYLKNTGLTPEIVIRVQYKKLIYDIVPKLHHDREIISFLHTTLKNQIQYMFTQKFPFRFNPINTIDVDSEDGTNPFEKIEQAYQHDEGLGIINAKNIESIIKKYTRELNYNPTKEEVVHYNEHIVINDLQRKILGSLFQRELGRREVINYASRYQYIKLLLLAEKILLQQELHAISDYLMGTPVEADIIMKETLTGKRFTFELMGSKSIQRIHKKFEFVSQRLADGNLIVKFIATMDRNKFKKIQHFGEEAEEELLSYSINNIADEVIRFIHFIS
jgi:hypothetical protein